MKLLFQDGLGSFIEDNVIEAICIASTVFHVFYTDGSDRIIKASLLKLQNN